MTYTTIQEIEGLIHQFECCTLPRHQWSHTAHLTVAVWYLVHHAQPDAIALIRQGIQHYNAALGIASTPTGGYHETITQFWIHQLQHHIAQHPNRSRLDLVNSAIATYPNPNLIFDYYSREVLSSVAARIGWVG